MTKQLKGIAAAVALFCAGHIHAESNVSEARAQAEAARAELEAMINANTGAKSKNEQPPSRNPSAQNASNQAYTENAPTYGVLGHFPTTDADHLKIYQLAKEWWSKPNNATSVGAPRRQATTFNDSPTLTYPDGGFKKNDGKGLILAIQDYCVAVLCLPTPGGPRFTKEPVMDGRAVHTVSKRAAELGFAAVLKAEDDKVALLKSEYLKRGPQGKFELSNLLENGTSSVRANPLEARKLREEASQEGYAPASFAIGKGLIDKYPNQNFQMVIALQYLRLAQTQGSKDAEPLIVKLDSKLSEDKKSLCDQILIAEKKAIEEGKIADAKKIAWGWKAQRCQDFK